MSNPGICRGLWCCSSSPACIQHCADNIHQSVGISGGSDKHSVKEHGSKGSHPFWKLQYYDETKVRNGSCITGHIIKWQSLETDRARVLITFVLQVRGPDAMHTLAGEIKACFGMLSGDPYTNSSATAQGIRDFEAQTNQRYKAAAAASAPFQYPFVLSKEQQSNISRTLGSIKDEGAHIPRGWSSMNLQHCFAHPSWLKAHDWLLLAGPIGKYALKARHPVTTKADSV